MSSARTDLKTGSIKSHLVRMTIPMIWGIAAIVSLQMVDTYYVSLLGTEKLAAMSFTFPVTMFIFSIIMGFGIAMSSVISRLIGEGREEDVRRVTTHGFLLVFGVAAALGTLGYVFHEDIFTAMGADAAMRTLIHDYMSVWFLGVPFLALSFVGNSSMRAAGNAATPALILVGMASLNAIIAPFFVFGLFGVPRLEMQGAGVATVISQISATAACLYIVSQKKKMILPITAPALHLFRDSAKRLLFIALAAGLTASVPPFINSVIVSLLSAYGPEAVASFGIASRIEAFAFIILMALAVGMGPIIGQNFGARNFERVHETLRTAIGFGIVWSILMAAIVMIFTEEIVGMFTQDAVVAYYAEMAFMIIAPTYMFANIVSGWSSAFNAMGKPQMSLGMTIIKMFCVLMPALFIGAHIGGVVGILIAIAGTNILTGIAFHLWSQRICLHTEADLALKAS